MTRGRAVLAAGALLIGVLGWPAAGWGQAFCDEGMELVPGQAVVALSPLLEGIIGEPLVCEHMADNGDLLQETSGGLAFVQAESEIPTFTNGSERWALVDGELIYQAVSEPEPVAAPAPAPPPPPVVEPPPPAPIPPPPSGLTLIAFNEAASGPYLYWARQRCTYGLQAFERGSPAAAAVISWLPKVDDSLDKPNLLRLGLAWPGVATSKTMAGPVASALVGPLTVRWTAYADRLVQDVVVPTRPVGDRLTQQLTGQGIVVVSASAGGYVATDLSNVARFVVRAPTVVDARGRVASGTLTWAIPSATTTFESTFLSAAVYPITVSTTVEYSSMYCFPPQG